MREVQNLDRVVAGLGLLFQLVAIAIASLDLIQKIQLFIVFKVDANRPRIFFNDRLIGRRTVATHRL
jgi:hypothetical protein